MRFLASVLGLGLAGGASPAAGQSLTLDVRPAWNGLARPAAWTELDVRLLSERGGEVALEVRGSTVTSRLARTLEAGVPASVRVPAWVGSDLRLELTGRGPGGAPIRREVPLRRSPPAVAVVGVPLGAAEVSTGDSWRTDFDAASLPAYSRSYETLDALVLDDATLARSTRRQRRALTAHLGACGRVLLHGVRADSRERLRAAAGCGGAFVESSARGDASADPLASLLARPTAPGEPAAGSRGAEGSRRPASAGPLALFLATYAGVLLVGAVAVRTATALAVIPLAASVALVASFGLTAPARSLVARAQATDGDGTARFWARLSVDGFAPGVARIALPAGLGLPDPPATGPLDIRLEGDDGSLVVEVPLRLLERRTLRLRGAAPWHPSGPTGEGPPLARLPAIDAVEGEPWRGWTRVEAGAAP